MTMQRTISLLAAGLLSLMASQSAQAALITEWNFTTAATGPLTSYAASSFDSGIVATPGLSTSGGVAVPSVTGGVLTYSYNGNNVGNLNNCAFVLSLTASSLADYSGLSVAFTDSGNGALTSLTGQWSYRFGTTGGFTTIGSSFNLIPVGTKTTTLTGITISAGQTLQLQFVMSAAAGGNNGQLNFDNLDINGTVTPVPEPVHYALACFGLIFVTTGVGRWYQARLKRA
jgi:hypothetical protein